MRKYELALVLLPSLDEEKLEKVIEDVNKILKDVSGKIKKHDLWEKRPLAYPIAKQKEAKLLFLDIEAKSISPKVLEKLKSVDEVMRYLLLNK